MLLTFVNALSDSESTNVGSFHVLLASDSLLLGVSVSAEEYRNIGLYWEMFERLGSLGLRTAGVHGWLQVAAIETVSKQTSSLPQRQFQHHHSSVVLVLMCSLPNVNSSVPFRCASKVSKASCKA